MRGATRQAVLTSLLFLALASLAPAPQPAVCDRFAQWGVVGVDVRVVFVSSSVTFINPAQSVAIYTSATSPFAVQQITISR